MATSEGVNLRPVYAAQEDSQRDGAVPGQSEDNSPAVWRTSILDGVRRASEVDAKLNNSRFIKRSNYDKVHFAERPLQMGFIKEAS